MKKNKVSINLPLYGTFDKDRLKLSIESIKNQSYKDIEVILSEQNPLPTFENESKSLGLKYCFSPLVLREGMPYFSPSVIRNKGLKISEGEFCYISDGDIIFLDQNMIKNLVNLLSNNNEIVAIKPKMRRLKVNDFVEFSEEVERFGIGKVIKSLFFPDDFIATIKEKKSDTLSVKFGPKKIYTTSAKNYEKYLSDQSFIGFDPRIWSDRIHYGMIFTRLKNILQVSGYSERYLHWGYEDVDTQWKLSKFFDFQEITNLKEFEVLHLDHLKNYFSKDISDKNQKIFERRVAEGINRSIEYDRKHNSVYLDI
jgi:hypothetical protein